MHFAEDIDWEPLSITLKPADPPSADAVRLEVGKWLSRRDSNNGCPNGCMTKYFDVRGDGNAITLSVQWVCNVCLGGLLDHIALGHGHFDEAFVGGLKGQHENGPAARDEFVIIPRRLVSLEDGCTPTVGPFEISRFPLTVGEFEAFANTFHYRTSAEASGRTRTYKNNGTLYNATLRQTGTALFLSQVDALEYCRRTGYRLPTDAELLAAITLDESERELAQDARAAMYRDYPRILRGQGKTVTSTVEASLAVVRSGPWVTKHPGWKQASNYRYLVPRTEGVGQMYVVR